VKSYQLWAEHGAPVVKGANVSRQASYDHTAANAHEFMGKAMQAAGAMIQKHAAEQLAKPTSSFLAKGQEPASSRKLSEPGVDAPDGSCP
jgi:hypothetical protein